MYASFRRCYELRKARIQGRGPHFFDRPASLWLEMLCAQPGLTQPLPLHHNLNAAGSLHSAAVVPELQTVHHSSTVSGACAVFAVTSLSG